MDENVEPSKPNLKDRVTEKYIQMKERVMLNTVKDHVEKNKTAYIIGGVVVTIVTIRILTKGSGPTWTYAPKSIEMLNKIKLTGFNWKPEINANSIRIFTEGPGRPSNLVYCVNAERFFPSQHEAARYLAVSDKMMSDHLNGKLPDLFGYVFTRPGIKG